MGVPGCELNTAIADGGDSQPPHSCAGHSVLKKPGELQQLAVSDARFHSILELKCTVGNFCVKRDTIKVAEKFLIP